jgi:ABC-2 type transport system permease protein
MGARWRIALNGVRRGARWRKTTYALVGLALLFLGLVALLVSYALTVGIAELTAPEVGRADVVVAVTLGGTLSLSVLVGFTVALAALYLSADLDLLLSAPLDRRSVFASKLLGGLLPAQLIMTVMALVPLLGHGLAMDYGGAYFAAAALALFLLPVLPASIGAISVMVIVRRVSAHRLGDVVALVIVAMTLSIALIAGGARQLQEAITLDQLLAVFERLRTPYSPAEWLTRAVTAAGRHDAAEVVTWFGLTAIASAVALVALIVVADRIYFSGWAHLQSADRRQEMRGSRLPWNQVANAPTLGRPSGIYSRLTQPTVAVMRKDLRVIPRDLTNMAQVLSPLAVGVFFVLQRLLYPIRLGGVVSSKEMLDPLLVMLSAAIATAVSAMIMSRFCLTAVSMEGRAYWLLRSSPTSIREFIAGKFLVAYVPYLLVGGGLVLVLELARWISDARADGSFGFAAVFGALDPFLLGYAWFVVAVVGAGMLAMNLALGASRPNLRWDTPHEMLTPDLGCLSLVTYGAYGMIAGIALVIPAATMGFPVVDDSPATWILGIGLGVGLTLIVIATGYRLALHELADLEV